MKTAVINKQDGKWRFASITLDTIMSLLPNGDYILTVKKRSEKRSLNQNSLMWLWFACIEDSTGTDKQTIHDIYCTKFLCRLVPHNGDYIKAVKGTSKLTKDEMQKFMNEVQADAATELGITLPTPDDLIFEEFYNTYKSAIT